MEQNNFEKMVQHSLDELKIPPSDAVWANVEKHIGRKNKDRKLIFIFFFLAVILLSGAYWLFNPIKNNAPQSKQTSQLKKDSKQTNNEDSSFAKTEMISGISANIDSASVSGRKTKSFKVNSQNKNVTKRELNQRKSDADFTSKPKEDFSKRTNNEDSQRALNNVNKLARKTTNAEIDNKNESEKIANNFQNQINTDSFLIQLESEKAIQKLISKNTSLLKKDAVKAPEKRWNFGITISAGSSFIGNNILEKNYPMADLNAGFPPGGVFSNYYSPSPIKNSTAFTAGVFIEKNIFAKTKFSFGLSYKYYSLVNKVGYRIDLMPPYQYRTSSNTYYSSANTFKSYTNNFHFLEVPVSVTLNLNRNKKLPLSWNAGVNISELISSNALQFQTNPGVYYHDNSMFNKIQLGLNTGVSIMFFAKENNPITVGPYFYYNPTNIASKGLYQEKHFSSIGIQANILFRKK